MNCRLPSLRRRRLLSPCVFAVFAVFGLNGAIAGEGTPRAWPAKNNMLKEMIVELLDGAPDAKQPLAFRFSLLIIGSAQVDGRDCWKIAFNPGDKTPPESKKRFEILVDKALGWPRKVTAVKADTDAKIQKLGDAYFIANATENIPFDFLPMRVPKEFSEGAATLKYQTSTVGKDTVVELAYLVDGKEKLRIRQRWTEGDAWWRYYDKQVDGKLVMRARLSSEPAQNQAFATNDAPAVKETDEHPLRRDKRLYALVQIEPKRPSVAHVIGRIKEATGVEIELGPELADHVPDLGYIEPNPKGYFAWQLMEHLGNREIANARWEPTKTGYRFTGVSKVPPGRELVTSGDAPKPPPEEPAPSSRLNLWLVASAAGLLGLFGCLGAALAFWKWSNARQTNVQDSAKRNPKGGNPKKA